jgi:hypothetical protein
MRKVQFEFADETYAAINNLAEITGARSMSAVIRDALKTYAWLIEDPRDQGVGDAGCPDERCARFRLGSLRHKTFGSREDGRGRRALATGG